MITFVLWAIALVFLFISALSKPVGKTSLNALGCGMFLWLLGLWLPLLLQRVH